MKTKKRGLKEVVFKLCQKLAKQSETFELPIAVVAKRISSQHSYASALLAILIQEGRLVRVESGSGGKPSKFRLGTSSEKPVERSEPTLAITDDDIQEVVL